jgi:prophage regulatory protein
MNRLLLSRRDLRRLGIRLSRWTIARLEAKGAFPRHVVVGERRIAWPRDAVLQWIEERNKQ